MNPKYANRMTPRGMDLSGRSYHTLRDNSLNSLGAYDKGLAGRRSPISSGSYPYGFVAGEGKCTPSPLTNRRMRQNGCGCGEGQPLARSSGMAQPSPCQKNRHDNANGGCGCGCEQDIHDCHKLLRQIQTVDFALYEVILYLDAYPEDCEALETYHKLLARRKTLISAYEEACGPMTAHGNVSTTSWDWVKTPAPWEYPDD